MNKFNERLKELRNENNLYQKDLATKLGFNQATVAKWETGEREPDFDTLIKIAKLFNVSTDYLLGLED